MIRLLAFALQTRVTIALMRTQNLLQRWALMQGGGTRKHWDNYQNNMEREKKLTDIYDEIMRALKHG